jgi:hypothetical protein
VERLLGAAAAALGAASDPWSEAAQTELASSSLDPGEGSFFLFMFFFFFLKG